MELASASYETVFPLARGWLASRLAVGMPPVWLAGGLLAGWLLAGWPLLAGSLAVWLPGCLDVGCAWLTALLIGSRLGCCLEAVSDPFE